VVRIQKMKGRVQRPQVVGAESVTPLISKDVLLQDVQPPTHRMVLSQLCNHQLRMLSLRPPPRRSWVINKSKRNQLKGVKFLQGNQHVFHRAEQGGEAREERDELLQ